MSTPEGNPVDWRLRLVAMLKSGEARRLREQAGITQAELAQRLGASWASVQRWEAGDYVPRDIRVVYRWNQLLGAIQRALDVDPTASTRPAARLRQPQDGNRER